MYKWWYLYLFELKRKTQYFWDEILYNLGQCLWVVSVLIVFLQDKQSLGQKEIEFLSYLLIGNIFFALLSTITGWDLGEEDIKKGRITSKLLLPSSIIKTSFVSSLAHASITFCTFFVLFLPGLFWYKDNLVFSYINFLLLAFYLPIAFLIRFLGDFLAGLSSFWLTSVYGVYYMTSFVFVFLSGSLFPLDYLPKQLRFLEYSPFAFTFYQPMQIYLNKYSSQKTGLIFILGLFWVFVLYFLVKFMFKKGLEKNQSVGL
jgi:ABC-2 type transport system permease protein